MRYHANATLTCKQRQEIRRLSHEEHMKIAPIADRFQVNWKTAYKWAHRETPDDRSSTPKRPHTVITDAYRTAVLDYRQMNPSHGPLRIVHALRAQYPQAHRETVRRMLRAATLTHASASSPRAHTPIPVGRHRVQMDIQPLPAIEGQHGFEYKISLIHLRTRVTYSEIHAEATSDTVAGVLNRACDRLPPFFS